MTKKVASSAYWEILLPSYGDPSDVDRQMDEDSQQLNSYYKQGGGTATPLPYAARREEVF